MRSRLAAIIVVFALTAAAVFGAVNLARGAGRQVRAVRANDANPFEIRYGGGAHLLDVDRRFTLAALAYVRGTTTYAIVTNQRVNPSNPYTLPFMVTYFIGRLIPARIAAPSSAQWILCYGCAPSTYPQFDSVWAVDDYAILHRRP